MGVRAWSRTSDSERALCGLSGWRVARAVLHTGPHGERARLPERSRLGDGLSSKPSQEVRCTTFVLGSDGAWAVTA